MLLPKQRRKDGSPVRGREPRSSRPAFHRFFRPRIEQLEDRLVLNYSFVGSTLTQWVELNGDPSATTVISAVDDAAKSINLGSNTINFYGKTYTGATAFWASSNGLITFGTGNSAFINGDLKSSPTQAAISPLWTDLVKTSAEASASGPMLLAKIDTVHSCLIVEWNQVTDQNTLNPITFEAIIQLNTGSTPGNIIFNFLQLDPQFKSVQSSVGIKDAGIQGPNSLVVSFNMFSPLVDNNQVITFTWQSPIQIPVISSLGTTSAVEGSSALTLTVNGSNFANTSFIQFGGTALTTSFINTTLLQATIPASLLAEEGSFNVTVVTPGSSGGTSNAVAFTVSDASLTTSGQLLSGTEGQTLTGGLVATFTDPGSDGTAADYSATVTWDDGNAQSHSSSGTVQLLSGNMFAVYADNTVPYGEEGTYGVTVVISDKGGSQATVGSEVMVGDAALTTSATTLSGTEGASFSGIVATFTDADPIGVLSDYTASIDWGDGQTSTGTITSGTSGSFTVSGSHSYLEEGNYAVSVAIGDAGGASATAGSTAAIADAALTAQGTNISSTEGSAFSGVVATFTDADPNGALSDYTDTIDWGDGQTSTGAISLGSAGSFVVSGSHTNLEEGSFTVSVLISDAGGASAPATGNAAVADATLTDQVTSISGTEGASFTGVVATFTDADPNGSFGDYTATIDWGDGQSSSGTITAGPAGNFLVSGSHTYAEEGTNTVTVQIKDVGGAAITETSSAVVGDAALNAQGTSVSGMEGSTFSGEVATFSDANASAPVADFSVTLNWGDGNSSTGTAIATGGGQFLVVGNHTYAEEGAYTVGVSITDVGGASASASSNAGVADAPLATSGLTVNLSQGSPFTGVVATFTDGDPNGAVTDYSASIDWGDGTTSTGSVQADPNGGFDVTGSHAYSLSGTFTIGISIADAGGAVATASSTAQVAATMGGIAASGTTVKVNGGQSFTVVLANFSESNPSFTAADFTAVIDWGDGSTSAGAISPNSNGGFSVSGTHTYFKPGAKKVDILIQDIVGSTAEVQSKVVVQDGGSTLFLTVRHSNHGHHVELIGRFLDLSSVSEDHKTSVNWGDETITVMDLGISQKGQFTLSHDYSDQFLAKHHGVVQVTVTIRNHDGLSSIPHLVNVNFNNGHHHGENGDIWDIPGLDLFS